MGRGNTSPPTPRRRTSHFCKVCYNRFEGEGEVCSPACKRERTMQKRRIYDVRARNESWTERRFKRCVVCGTRLQRPGSYCSKHQKERRKAYMTKYRQRKKQ